MRKKNGCYQCTQRRPGCHDACEKYRAWKAAAEEEKRKIAAAKRSESAADGYQRATAERLRKKK